MTFGCPEPSVHAFKGVPSHVLLFIEELIPGPGRLVKG